MKSPQRPSPKKYLAKLKSDEAKWRGIARVEKREGASGVMSSVMLAGIKAMRGALGKKRLRRGKK